MSSLAMSSLKVNQIKARLRELFEPHLNVSDISPRDAERDQKILTRCLAALAVSTVAGCTPKLAAESVWDGSGDNGIDAAYFDPSDQSVVFVQSKWINAGTGEPEAKDIGTFVTGVRDAIEQSVDAFHNRLHASLQDIFAQINTPGTSVHLVVVTTGLSQLAKPSTLHFERLLSDLNGADPHELVTWEILGLSEVYTRLASDPEGGHVTLEAQILDWSRINSPYVAYFGIVDGYQLKTWWKRHGKSLVVSNIRHSLGGTDVNNEIRQTALNSPEKFWYFNNGITLIAEEAIVAPAKAATQSAGQFRFRGASIVNGAQTVSSLGRIENDTNLGLVRVPIRVIILESAPAGFGKEVTRTNNLQNRIESRDFVAQDPEQKRLKEEMAVEGIDYQFLRSEEVSPSASSCELMEVTVALACASGDPLLAVQAKTGIGKFFNDLQKAPYRAIYNPSTSGARAFNATAMNRHIYGWIERRKKSSSKKDGPSWGVLVHGNRILSAAVFRLYGLNRLSKTISDFRNEINDPAPIYRLCNDVHARMTASIEREFPDKFLAVLFKNPSHSKVVFEDAVRTSR
ncbi:hypothetical protein IP86_20110 [Rhodopseudomonas sp. AAP120]|uniref:AIPR family protein n=1 Tax=Rhodopseudomonas sp. AAP120 TaxID=1523430 RepID=UPI0006B8D68C|nr:AIPR family protein [Rhodopseudomonas sp. AAP120]KPF95276.1 hypothetical protein IP86_20110 [Rhodopseudomonas sp. AAP120]